MKVDQCRRKSCELNAFPSALAMATPCIEQREKLPGRESSGKARDRPHAAARVEDENGQGARRATRSRAAKNKMLQARLSACPGDNQIDFEFTGEPADFLEGSALDGTNVFRRTGKPLFAAKSFRCDRTGDLLRSDTIKAAPPSWKWKMGGDNVCQVQSALNFLSSGTAKARAARGGRDQLRPGRRI